MMNASFDIFDTCLTRKCGTPENFFDVLSLRAFCDEIEEWERQEFVTARRITELKCAEINPYYTLQDIWDAFAWKHPKLKSKDELYYIEQETEREMLVPVLKVRDQVNQLHKKEYHVIFISDMYLSSTFLCDLMHDCGFLQDGDSLYVSCECKAEKRTGTLYEYVRDNEGISYSKWHHYGDNPRSDYSMPRRLGISSTLVNHLYTPYQQNWKNNTYPLGYNYSGILAGLGRALHYSTEWTTHTDFVLDVIAPFYCSLVYRMMRDAQQKGICRLYFCARDAYMMYQIALQYKELFPSIEARFLYISRKALYDGEDMAKIAYYEQVGLATKDDGVGIVDIRSTGKTLQFLNQYLSSKGYKTVRGYYFELFCGGTGVKSTYSTTNYYAELSDKYYPEYGRIIGERFHIFENFFPLNNVAKTIDYVISDGIAAPVFGSDDIDDTLEIEKVFVEEKDKWVHVHERLLNSYAKSFVACGLHKKVDDIFQMAIDTIFSFLLKPDKYYLSALECLYGKNKGKSEYVPYVKKESLLKLLITRGSDSIWQQATVEYNNMGWLQDLYRKCKHRLGWNLN